MKKPTSLIAFSAIYLFTTAQSWQDTVTRIEKIFERYKSNKLGAQIAN